MQQPPPQDGSSLTRREPGTGEGMETRTPEQSIADLTSGLRALAGSHAAEAASDGAWRSEVERQDKRAGIYDEVYEGLLPCFRAYEDWVTEAIYSAWYEGRGRLLVVGCGAGGQLKRLAQRMPVKLITAIDLSPEMTKRAREKNPAIHEIRTIPFDRYQPAVPFDVVAFTGALAAMPDLRAAASHAAQMTLHGSRIVVCARNVDWLWRDPAGQSKARLRYPLSWLGSTLAGRKWAGLAAERAKGLESPHPELTPESVKQAFGSRFGLRSELTAFGVTRLFEGRLAIPPDQVPDTFGPTRERRPWTRAIERLQSADESFNRQHPLEGGLFALLFDKLH